jgi:hypothetical protein
MSHATLQGLKTTKSGILNTSFEVFDFVWLKIFFLIELLHPRPWKQHRSSKYLGMIIQPRIIISQIKETSGGLHLVTLKTVYC